MSIEQTNQLILLILNSVLMALLSAGLLGGAWLRQNSLLHQLRQVRSRYRKVTHGTASLTTIANPTADNTAARPQTELRKADFKKIRDRRQQLSRQYHWSHVGMLVLHMALWVFSLSLFALALRALFAFDALISTALVLFTLGAGGLLTGTGCVLVDLAQGNSNSDSLGKTLGRAIARTTQQWKRLSHRYPNGIWVGKAASVRSLDP
ncbi:MAG: hypothetical protein AAFP20_08585 [Cyanobacteria bacterium J06614_10]